MRISVQAWSPDYGGEIEMGALEAISIEEVRQYYRGLYRPNGTIIGAAGNIDWPLLQDLVGNQVDVMIVQVAEAVAQSQAGRLKAFAVTSKERLPGAPDIPIYASVKEAKQQQLSLFNEAFEERLAEKA